MPAPDLRAAYTLPLDAAAPAPSLALPWEQDIVALRRDFHAHPELGYEEVRTAAIVAERLRALGLEVRTGVGGTGVVALLRGEAPGAGRVVLVRADMDALPVDEQNGWAWKSATAGKMHACAHDAHTATGLTVARLMAQCRQEFAGTVKFMFQPAEEGLGGAQGMLDEGLLDDPRPDVALALHVWAENDIGQVAIKPGAVMAATDSFKVRIIGKGGHGAMPHQTVDPVMVAAFLVQALQTTVSRNIDPQQAGVVTIGKMWGGSAFNVIPAEAFLEGTVRSFDAGVQATLERRCRELVEELPRAFGARGEFHYQRDFPATVNDSAVTAAVKDAISTELGATSVVDFVPTMGAEDMSLVLRQIPGCYFFVGGRNAAIDAVYPHHHPRFNIDEQALHIGTRAMLAAIKRCLQP